MELLRVPGGLAVVLTRVTAARAPLAQDTNNVIKHKSIPFKVYELRNYPGGGSSSIIVNLT